MSSPIRLFCRTCKEDARSPDGMSFEEMQEWFDIRHELTVVREKWPGLDSFPQIPFDYEGALTFFLCDHKDCDLCMSDCYDFDEVVEFKRDGK